MHKKDTINQLQMDLQEGTMVAIGGVYMNLGQQIRSKIDSFQNANFLIAQPNPMMLPLIGIVSERRFQ